MNDNPSPSPDLFFETITAYQRTAALKAAMELDVFSAIDEGSKDAKTMASHLNLSERGCRILCDYLSTLGFLEKSDSNYSLTSDSASFLSRRSPAYLGAAVEFLISDDLSEGFDRLAEAVRKGGTAKADQGIVEDEHPVWVQFARGMAPLAAFVAREMADVLIPGAGSLRVLDVAAGHGMYGITLAQRNPKLEVTAVDWPTVLEVAQENAEKAEVGDRFRKLPGDAFEVDFGTGYDLVLLTNFLHHFGKDSCRRFLAKVHASLAEGGRVAILEFVPNPDRITPPRAARFSLTMLSATPEGDAYTLAEFEEMLAAAGYTSSELHHLPGGFQSVVIGHR